MSAYREACAVEQEAKPYLLMLLRRMALQPETDVLDLTDLSGSLAKRLQLQGVDALFRIPQARIVSVDYKVEEENRHGNFFFETWSYGARRKPGWLYNVDVDLVLYFFAGSRRAYLLSVDRLRRWLFTPGERVPRLFDYPEKRQRKREQSNDTWGRCVPIADVWAAIGFEEWAFVGGAWELARKASL